MTVLAFPRDSMGFIVHGQLVGIPLLILATQETRCVGKSGGNSPVKKKSIKQSRFPLSAPIYA
jgi:hypothetical protein